MMLRCIALGNLIVGEQHVEEEMAGLCSSLK